MSKRLVTRDDVCSYLGIATTDAVEPYIATAEALVTAYLQCKDLHEHYVSQKTTILYDLGAGDKIELRDGPAAELVSLNVEHINIDLDSNGESSDVILSEWSLEYLPGL